MKVQVTISERSADLLSLQAEKEGINFTSIIERAVDNALAYESMGRVRVRMGKCREETVAQRG